MAKQAKFPSVSNEKEAFEIIELAADDLDTLARAFDMIAQVCREENGEPITADVEEMVLN